LKEEDGANDYRTCGEKLGAQLTTGDLLDGIIVVEIIGHAILQYQLGWWF
jgi:hypothetical protein